MKAGLKILSLLNGCNCIKEYLEYKKWNTTISEILDIKRDKEIEKYLFWNIPFFMKKDEIDTELYEEKKLKKWKQLWHSSRSYFEYYKGQDNTSFEDLNYIVCRLLITAIITGSTDFLEQEVNAVDNYFTKAYLINKITEVSKILFQENLIDEPIEVAQ